ncbi:death effector domain-containing 1 isoform X2 [Esox lucius]|uniref:DED domain-containing protein n=1 Tax=Esox lucius TaxID=8010 RepID=A0A3P9AB65_ESOLU|nr:death effector domain-containing 1 isoform X2 [Esox lucius]
MATIRRPRCSLRDSLYWDETECLTYYGMLSLHEMFEVVGSQLTEMDVEVLSFLLDETYPAIGHPLDPAGWTSEPCEGDPEAGKEEAPSPALLVAWRRLQSRGSALVCPTEARHKPKSGLELLLELERRGYLSESTLEPLLQLLRVLTRHDLLPLVSRKKRRTVSPERFRLDYGSVDRRTACPSALTDTSAQTESPDENSTQQWRRGVDPARTAPAPLRKKRGKGRRWTSKPVAHKRTVGITETPAPPVPEKVTCDIRLRVRAEYWEHESALRGGVSSDKQQPLERQFELFSRASSVLRARDLGSIICDIKFSELENLEAFWGDYLSGALLEALKGVFITDSLRRAAGREGVRLLISVDQDDYEEGRKLLLDSQEQQAGCWGGDRS